jgi:hypothetical protein
MKKLITHLVLPCFAIFVLTGCPDFGNCSHPRKLHLDTEVKSYFDYNKGSYWIYESDSGSMDTIVIAKRDSNQVHCDGIHGGADGPEYFVLMYSLTSTYKPGDIQSFEVNPSESELANGNKTSTISYKLQNQGRGIVNFFSNAEPGALSPVDNVQFVWHFDSTQIHNVVYKEIKVFESIGTLDPGQDKFTWWAKGVGVIKRQLFNGTTWSLTQYSLK